MKKELNEKDLSRVNGGTAYILDDKNDVKVHSGPGSNYSTVYTVNSGDMVFTRGVSLFNKDVGYEWEEMTDGNWIPKNVL